MFDIFKEYKEWVSVNGCLEHRLAQRKDPGSAKSSDLIKVAEAFHEKKLAGIADSIYEANVERGARIVLISGPSSSGKTTFAKRLGIELRILGLRPVMVSLDGLLRRPREYPPRREG